MIEEGVYNIMKKQFMLGIMVSEIVMLILPWLAVAFVKGDNAMAVCFILFYVVNPIHSIIAGIYAGKDSRDLWGIPLISAILFLIGTWISFGMGENAFIIYAAVYLILGVLAMLASMSINRKKEQQK